MWSVHFWPTNTILVLIPFPTFQNAGNQPKIINPGQPGMVPAQIILQQTPTGLKAIETQSADTSGKEKYSNL